MMNDNVKIYTIRLDDYEKEVVLQALMERACNVAKNNKTIACNIRMVYGNIKEQIIAQEK